MAADEQKGVHLLKIQYVLGAASAWHLHLIAVVTAVTYRSGERGGGDLLLLVLGLARLADVWRAITV